MTHTSSICAAQPVLQLRSFARLVPPKIARKFGYFEGRPKRLAKSREVRADQRLRIEGLADEMIKALGFLNAGEHASMKRLVTRSRESPAHKIGRLKKGMQLARQPSLAVAPAAYMWPQLVPAFIVIQLLSCSGSALAQQPGEQTLTKTSAQRVAQDVEAPRDRVESTAPEPATASPIRGVKASELRDSFNETHDGHRHEAIDISESEGTPVRAVVDGTIQKLFLSKAGGNTIYEFDRASVYCYYYAHLERYADGLHDGMPVSRGEVIGYVGSTGNASAAAPHLHFAIYLLGPQKRWWEGIPIDPYPVLERTLKRSRPSSPKGSCEPFSRQAEAAIKRK